MIFPIGTRVQSNVYGKIRNAVVIGSRCRDPLCRRVRFDGKKEPDTIHIKFLTVLEPSTSETLGRDNSSIPPSAEGNS